MLPTLAPDNASWKATCHVIASPLADARHQQELFIDSG
jgi:hypothetical protein